jgi:Ca2+-binding RTX toxin-like protein
MRIALLAIVVPAAVLSSIAAGTTSARPHPTRCTNVIQGTPASESLDGTPGNDRINGFAGDDRLIGESGSDCLDGGLDADQLIGSAGDDRIAGAGGNDVLEGDRGADDLAGQAGDDSLHGGGAADRLWAGGGADLLHGDAGADVLRGEGGPDRLYGGAGPDRILGGPGNDDIREVPDNYSATDPLDTGRNRIESGGGRDRVNVANGRRDVVDCGSGVDSVTADKGDKLSGCEHKQYLIAPFPAVKPAVGGRTRNFLIKFRSIGTVGPTASYFSIVVKGPPGRGCGKLDATSLGMAYHRDRAVRYRLDPFSGKSRKAKRWCRGRYTGQVTFVDKASGAKVMVGRFSYKVKG